MKYIDYLYVSTSGFSQEVHSINHKGGNIENVKNNLVGISEEKRLNNLPVNIHVRYLNFGYNSSESELMRDFIKNLGLNYQFDGTMGDPTEQRSLDDFVTYEMDITERERERERERESRFRAALFLIICRWIMRVTSFYAVIPAIVKKQK